MVKIDQLLNNRLADDRHRHQLHDRAIKLRHHYSEMEACDKIMAYGFIVILLLCSGFLWFIKVKLV